MDVQQFSTRTECVRVRASRYPVDSNEASALRAALRAFISADWLLSATYATRSFPAQCICQQTGS
eukprot:2452661-Pleurochrysis_carterae.AAC.3